MPSNTFSIERVVTLLTPVFATFASWFCAFIGTHVPGAPHLDPGAVEGVEAAAFLGTAAIVFKWLHGRQIPAIAGLSLSPVQIDQFEGEIETYLHTHASEFKADERAITADIQEYIDSLRLPDRIDKQIETHIPAQVVPDVEKIAHDVEAKITVPNVEQLVEQVIERIRSGLGSSPPAPVAAPGATPVT